MSIIVVNVWGEGQEEIDWGNAFHGKCTGFKMAIILYHI